MPGVVMVNYADDFLLLAESPALLKEAIGKLTDAVDDLPGGHFKLELKSTRDIDKGFDFLGHHLKLVEGELETSPTAANLSALWDKLNTIDEMLSKLAFPPGKFNPPNKDDGLRHLAKAMAVVNGWKSAFKECCDVESAAGAAAANLVHWLPTFGLTSDEIKGAIDPSMEYYPTGYALGH
jgi:hypothetical protein